jgi:hypothetical protein
MGTKHLCLPFPSEAQYRAYVDDPAQYRQYLTQMLRHACGFYLANQGYDLRLLQDYLGHRDPKHTVHYTRVAGVRFAGLWGGEDGGEWLRCAAFRLRQATYGTL